MSKSHHSVMLSLFKNENAEFNDEQINEPIICVGGEIEKFLPHDHHLLSLDKPGDSCGKFFHPTLTLVIDSIIIYIMRGHMLEFPNYRK